MDQAEKQKLLSVVLTKLQKELGANSIMILGDTPITMVPIIPTGSLSLDVALGVGGMPRGRIIEAYGPPGCGKTTLGLHMVAEAQKSEGLAAYVDLEHSLDLTYADAIGVKVPELLLSQPTSGDEGLHIVDELTRSGTIDIIIVDSVSALVPQAELDGHITDSHVGRQARMMSQGLRILAGRAAMTNTMIYFINQLRLKVGVLFGSPETTSGGEALKYYSSVRLDVRRKTAIKDGSEVLGAQTKVKVVKNKLAPPFKECMFDIIYGEGIDLMGDILDLGVEHGIIEKSGAWYSFQGERLGQGRNMAKDSLRSDEFRDSTMEIHYQVLRAALPHRFEDATEDETTENEGTDGTDT